MSATASRPGDSLRYLGAALILFVGGVHLQQYISFMKDVPTVGTLFMLNAIGAGAIALGIAGSRSSLPPLGGIGLCLGALVSVAIALYATFFDYTETWRTPTVLAVVSEVLAVAVLAAFILRRRAGSATTSRSSGAGMASMPRA